MKISPELAARVDARYQPQMDEYGRWAVQDTAQPFYYLFISRYVDQDSAQAMADILNATGSQQMDKLWKVHDRVVRYAPLIQRSGS